MFSTNNTSLNDLTDDRLEMNYNPKFITWIHKTITTLKDKLNFKIGRSAHVAKVLINKSDILEAREKNQMSVNKEKKQR